MNNQNKLYESSAWQKFQKVCRQLQQLLQSGSHACSEKIKSLTKRRDRYLKQFMSAKLSPAKTGSALAVAMLLAAQTNAQQCNVYADANAANPLLRVITKNDDNPVFVDTDNDGDLDCYLSGKYGYLTFFKNIGTKNIPVYSADKTDGFSGSVHIGQSIQFADMDGDGDYDCFITDGFETWNVAYFENTGTKTSPAFMENEAKNPLGFIRGSYLLYLSIADIDSDGDYDVFISDAYFNKLYQNTGTKTAPQFSKISDDFAGFDNRIYYDWNKDGLVDYIDFSGDSYYRNVGPTPADLHYVVDPNGPNFGVFDPYGLFSLGDINGDGTPEAFSYSSSMAAVTPVPVIRDSVFASLTKLSATPKNKNYKYQWQRNGKNIPGATKDVLFTPTSGFYTVEITNTCGTGVSLPFKLNTSAAGFAEAEASTIQFTKSLNTIEQPLLKAYPNPFTEHFSLYPGDSYLANTFVKITDVQGRTISTVKAAGTVMQLGSNLQKGVYIVQVIQNNVVVFTQKVIKQ